MRVSKWDTNRGRTAHEGRVGQKTEQKRLDESLDKILGGRDLSRIRRGLFRSERKTRLVA